MASIADLERERIDRQRAEYRRLQVAAVAAAFERRTGRTPTTTGEAMSLWPSESLDAVNPLRHLSEDECMRILSTATGAP
jgi:hypothetical protein